MNVVPPPQWTSTLFKINCVGVGEGDSVKATMYKMLVYFELYSLYTDYRMIPTLSVGNYGELMRQMIKNNFWALHCKQFSTYVFPLKN